MVQDAPQVPMDKEHMTECRTREFGVSTKKEASRDLFKRSLVPGVPHEGISLDDIVTSGLYISKF